MKTVGIVICNYNKCDFVLDCIQTVMESTFQDFDLFIVDNASTDASVTQIRERFGNKVNLLINHENLGGSGGFNTGISKVVAEGYEYIMCLDNDVLIDQNAIGALLDFLKKNPDVGMVGSKVYHLNAPEYIQQFGINIDFDQICLRTLYADIPDSEEIPQVVFCDSVAACSVMLPVNVVKEVGLLPADNFIYWDDIEWGYLVKQHGYKVAAYGESCVLHAMSAFENKNTSFYNYYHWRNCINFFMKYTPKAKLDAMSVRLLSDLFDTFYTGLYCQRHDIAQTILFAYQDAITQTRGRAKKGRILPHNKEINTFNHLIDDTNSYWIDNPNEVLEKFILGINPHIIKELIPENAKLRIKKCDRVLQLTDYSLDYCYYDDDFNFAVNKSDIDTIKNYSYSLQLFLYMNQNIFLDAVSIVQEN